MEKFIYKQITDAFYRILEKHNNPRWATEELDYLIYSVNKHKVWELTEDEQYQVSHIMGILKQSYCN